MPTKESEAICSLKQIRCKSAGTIVEVYSVKHLKWNSLQNK